MIFQSRKRHTGSVQINLLKKKELSFSSKLVFFALHYLRYIIILTQMGVIIVFFYRFYIDQQIIDLRESVGQQEELVKINVAMVEDAQAISRKAGEVKKIIKDQDKFDESLSYLLSAVPPKIVIDKFEQTADKMKLGGASADYQTVKNLYDKLKKDNKFKKVSINEISRRFNEFIFSINIEI